MKHLKIRKIIAAFIITAAMTASAVELGAPFITNFTPRDYNGSSQNWCVAQDQRGLIYFGNGRGVIEFDGSRRRLIPLSNNAAALSIAISADNKIFVGGKGEFGFLQPDSNSVLTYTSLMPLLNADERDFSDVWEIIILDNAVYFRTAERLFRYSPAPHAGGGTITSWKPSTKFHVMFRSNNDLYIRERGVGLYKIGENKPEFVSGSSIFADESVYAALHFTNRKLLITRSQGLFTFQDGKFTPFFSQAGEFIKKHRPIHAVTLDANLAVIATTNAGIIFIDSKARIVHHVDKKEGLRDNTVWYTAMDRDGGLWCALNNGISRVEFPSSMTLFDDRHGLTGTAQDIIRHQGALYVAASPSGVFKLQMRSNGGSTFSAFSSIEGISTQTWNFVRVNNRLLVAANTGIFEIKNNSAQKILPNANLEAAYLTRSRYDSTRIFAGLFGGMAVLSLRNNRWQLVQRFNLSDEIRNIVETEQGTLWLGTRSNGIYKIKLSKDLTGIAEKVHYNPQNGLPPGQTFAFLIDNELIFTTEDKGVYGFNENRQQFSPDMRFGPEFSDGSYDVELIVQSRDNRRVWLGAAETGAMIELYKENNDYKIVNNALSRLPKAAVRAIYEDDDNILWISTNEALCRYDENAAMWANNPFSAFVRRVSLTSDSLLFGGAQSSFNRTPPSLPHDKNSFRFEFAAASFNAMQLNAFQTYLEGYDKKWSQWTTDSWKEYTNLSPGVYTFKVRAKNIHDVISTEDSYTFRILPPWRRTIAAYILYLIIFATLIFAVDRIQRRRLLKRAKARTQRALAEAENQRRIKELEQAKSLQLSMLPDKLPQYPGVKIAAYMKTATEVGGDYYDFNLLNGELTGAIGDATGHGINAGMMVSITKGLFVAEAHQRSILEFFKKCNAVIRRMHLKRIYMALSIFKLQNNVLTMSAAGMPPAFRYIASKNYVEEISPKGMPLGATDEFPYKCEQRYLEKDDVVMFMSDGFPELFDPANIIIGYDAVPGILHKHAHKEPQAIIDAFVDFIRNWSKGRANDDDITFVVIKVQ